jgi:hypothetical protein
MARMYVMKLPIIILLVLFSPIFLSYSISETYTQKTGPFILKVTSDESVNFTVNPSLPMDNCNPYDVDIEVGDSDIYRLEIQEYGKPINTDENDLMSAILSFNPVSSEYYTSWELLKVGGMPGVLGTIGQGVNENSYPIHGFVAAYSPDGIGIHGATIAIIGLSANQNNFEQYKAKFEAFVKDIRISKQDEK